MSLSIIPSASSKEVLKSTPVWQINAMPYQRVKRELDAFGIENILELVAGGILPNEIAARLEYPIIDFNRWFKATVSKAELQDVLKLAAQSMVIKADLTLKVNPRNNVEGAALKAHADHLMKVAERIDSSTWGPQKVTDAPAAAVTINVMGNVPGLSALRSNGSPIIDHATPLGSYSDNGSVQDDD